ncbi:MAG: hypothetical protein TREMPRED_000061 [Tremellales sp. Tagirdzhanova-0007]|nr:MAG: hypothetical protein TREMPRED_000061 [Tremellales sp. Tagirdzhanova-0007]
MLIERGADVNAPRLPRRYSEGRKSTAPSVGAAGSTPLHFAAANGHAPIVQILLTCGATPDKSDKNGMTPEALAEVNGHIDVIRVLRVWERLQLRDSQSQHSSQGGSPAGPHSERGDSMSPHTSTSQLSQDDASEHYESVRSRTGRDRAMSFASTVSDTPSQRSQSLRLKRSLDGLLQGKRPDHAGSDSIHDAASPIVHDAKSQPRLPHDDAEADLLNPSSPMEVEPETAMPLHASLNADTSLERVFTATSAGSTDLASTPSSESIVSAPPGSVVAPQIASVILAPPPPRRNTYSSSHRPTLPSIFEKAVHPGVALRAAMRRDLEIKPRSSSDFTSSFEETSPRSASFSGSLFRGRNKTVEVSSRQAAARKYMSKQGLVQLFRRGQSPPSRSPSPPDRNDKVIAPEELDEGIERLKRASFELDFREGQEDSTEAIDPTEEEVRRPPASAPAIKTRFFEDLDAPALPPLNMAFYTARRDDRRPMSANTSGNERPRNRPRTGSEVISPSPLAKEWATDEDSDSYSSPRRGMRRAMSSVSHGNPLLRISPPVSPVLADVTELRFSTLRIASSPLDTCSTMSPNLTVDTEPRPEKLVSGVLEQENELHHPALEDSNGGEGEEEEFHDALDFGEPEILAPKVDPEAHALEPVSTEISLAETATQDAEGRAENIQPQTAAGVEQPVDEEEVRARESKSVELQGVQQISTNVPQRYRGASIGSVNTESSRISEPSESSPMTSLITDEDGSERGSLGYNPTKPLSDPKKKPSQRPPSVRSMVDGRPRNISVSSTSTSTSASGVAFSYMQTASTPGTSLTPASTLSVHLPGGFPPVPEHEVAPHPVARRKVSSRAEAADIVKQYEDDILQLAQMPLSQDSSRSLAAQLAAYGDNHAIEQEFAEREARATQSSDMDSSDNASFFSAGESAQSGISSPRSSERASQPSIGRKSRAPPSLLSIDAPPRSSVPSINSIYDKRAAAYRDRMVALTAKPPLPPPSTSSSRVRSRAARPGHVSETWLNAGPSQRRSSENNIEPEQESHPDISGPMPMVSPALFPSRVKQLSSIRTTTSRMQASHSQYASPSSYSVARSNSPNVPSRLGNQPQPHSPSTAPAPIADVVSARFQGFPPPISSQSITSPHISIFSSRYSGHPRDGGESDDDEQGSSQYTLIENDWRGGHIVRPDGVKKEGKWGQIKGAIGQIGRR